MKNTKFSYYNVFVLISLLLLNEETLCLYFQILNNYLLKYQLKETNCIKKLHCYMKNNNYKIFIHFFHHNSINIIWPPKVWVS